MKGSSATDLAIKLLRDAADFFEALGDNNPNLLAQMDENQSDFRQMAELMIKDPLGSLNGSPYCRLVGKLLIDASGFFRSLAEQNPPLREQMAENANVYRQLGDRVMEDPISDFDSHYDAYKSKDSSNNQLSSEQSLKELFDTERVRSSLELQLSSDLADFESTGSKTLPSFHVPDNADQEVECSSCGFKTLRYFFHCQASKENGNVVNQYCPFCSFSLRIDQAFESGSISFIWAPEFSQAALNRFSRDLLVSRISVTGQIPRRAWELLRTRERVLLKKLHIQNQRQVFDILFDRSSRSPQAKTGGLVAGLRILPLDRVIVRDNDLEYNQFPQILAFWRSTQQARLEKIDISNCVKRAKIFVDYETSRFRALGLDVEKVIAESSRPVETEGLNWNNEWNLNNLSEPLNNGIEAFKAGDFGSARNSLLVALRACWGDYGHIHSTTSKVYSWLATVENSSGNLEEACDYLDRAHEISTVALGRRHEATLNLFNLKASFFKGRGMFDKAAEVFSLKVSDMEKKYQVDETALCQVYLDLAECQHNSYDFDKAIEHFQKTAEKLAAMEVSEPFLRFRCFYGLGVSHQFISRLEESKRNFIEACNLAPDVGGEHSDLARLCFQGYAVTCCRLGDIDEALEQMTTAQEMLLQRGHNETAAFGQNLATISQCWAYLGDVNRAKSEIDKSLDTFANCGQVDGIEGLFALSLQSHYLDQLGKPLQAVDGHRKAIEGLQKAGSSGRNVLSRSLVEYSFHLLATGEPSHALTPIDEAQEILSSMSHGSNSFMGRAHYVKALALQAMSDEDGALGEVALALEVFDEQYSSRHPWFLSALQLSEELQQRS